MGVVSTPPLTPPIPPPPPASPERLMLTRDPSRPFFCGMNGSTSAESFTSCRETKDQSLFSQSDQHHSHHKPSDFLLRTLFTRCDGLNFIAIFAIKTS